jgi:hypothetical protein
MGKLNPRARQSGYFHRSAAADFRVKRDRCYVRSCGFHLRSIRLYQIELGLKAKK